MSCESFEHHVADLARGEALDDAARDLALAHAEGCLRCASRLEDERAVTSALRAFAARTAAAEAPPRVEEALRFAMRDPAALREGREASGGRSRALELLLLGAAAAILAAIVVVPPRVDRLGEPGGVAPGSPPAVVAGANGVAAAGAARSGQDFMALSYGEELGELDSLQVVSVELPPTALAALGWPQVGAGQTESVKAEVIVGHDGVARAIRFVD
jgi:hypothetical protein